MRRSLLVPCLIVLELAVLARAGAAQTPARSTRIGLSGSVGLFVPRDSTLSEVYGRYLVPMTAQADVPIASHFSIVGGLRWLPASGEAVQTGDSVPSEQFSTSVSVLTLRAGVLVHARVAPRWTLGGGGGVGISRYSESMPDLGLDTSGWAAGGFAMAEGRYAVRARWSVIGRFEYASIPITVSGDSINIGGPDVHVGLRFAF